MIAGTAHDGRQAQPLLEQSALGAETDLAQAVAAGERAHERDHFAVGAGVHRGIGGSRREDDVGAVEYPPRVGDDPIRRLLDPSGR